MKKAVPVSVTTLEMDEQKAAAAAPAVDTNPRRVWIDVLSIVLLAGAVLIGVDFWRDWFSSVDRSICSVGVIVGLIVAFFRSTWWGEPSGQRIAFAVSLWCLAGLVICMSLLLGRPKFSVVACGLILAAWSTMRILGEGYQHSLALGLVFGIPSAIDALTVRGAFDWLESVAVSVTSGLADAAGQPNVVEGDKIIFGQGVADKFSCIGEWDSLLSLVGVSAFCILAFRRNLLAGLVTIAFSAIVWIALRGSAWVALAWLGSGNDIWYEWTFGLEVGLILLGAILVFSVDQFFSAMLEPIPFEFVNTDFPLFTFVWNWLCGLPTLIVNVPRREGYFSEIEDDLGHVEIEA